MSITLAKKVNLTKRTTPNADTAVRSGAFRLQSLAAGRPGCRRCSPAYVIARYITGNAPAVVSA